MYSVKALKNSYIGFPVPALAMYFQEKIDETLDKIHVYIWLIKGQGKTVVVDTGLGSPPGTEPRTEAEVIGNFVIEPGRDTVSLLRSEGVEPEEVDYLILTHLHHDHCANVRLFPQAKICVSHRGWRDVVAPEHPDLVAEGTFLRSVLAYLIDEAWDRLLLLPEEASILPGLDVFWVGCHSPCSQAVKVSTSKGKVIIAGDAVFMYGNIEEKIPVALCTNLAECYHAMDRFLREGDIVLPNHDPLVLERYPGGVIA